MVNGRAQVLQKRSVKELMQEAQKLKRDFRDYLEDLELFSDPEFWEAVEETQKGKGKQFSSVKRMLEELDK